MDKMEEKGRCPVLILGIGNILLRDEGIGVRVIEALAQVQLPQGVEICDGGTTGADLLDVIAERKKIIVIDAMDAKREPGTVLKLRQDELAQGDTEISLHEIGLLATLGMAKQLGCGPDEVIIFGVQPEEVSCGMEMTYTLKEIVPGLVRAVLEEAEKSAS